MGDLSGGGWVHKLPDAVREAVRDAMQVRNLKDKQVVYHQGDDSIALYEVVKGNTLITHTSHDGGEALITIFGPNDCFGEQGLIDGLPRSNTVVSYGNCTLRTLLKQDFKKLQKRHPEVTESLLLLASHRFRLIQQMSEETSSFPLRTKILRRLYVLAKAHGKPVGDALEVNFKISQSNMGKWVGYSRQSVNAEIQKMEEDGLIRNTPTSLIITNLKAIITELGDDELILFNENNEID